MSFVKFINITEEEFLAKDLLFKYLPLENALRTLKDKTIWFANPSSWKDPFEKRFLNAKYIRDNKEVKFKWKDRVFCSCFTQTITSEAFWNTYTQNSIGIEFRIDRKKLLEELKKADDSYKIYIGKVEYLKTEDIKRGLRSIPFNPPIPNSTNLNTDLFAARLFLLKRIAFSYEDEIRIIIVKENSTKQNGIGFIYNCENTSLVQRIVIDPNIGDYTLSVLKRVFIEDFGFKPIINTGKAFNRVLRSTIYSNQSQVVLKLD